MTPEERLNQQLAMGNENDANSDDGNYSEAETTDEESAKFDKEGAEHELKRASLNAVDCPNTFEKDQLQGYSPGKATVSVVFEPNGAVKNVTVSAPYAETNVGNCVVRAMSSIRVEMFEGSEVPMDWEIELKEPKPPEAGPPKK